MGLGFGFGFGFGLGLGLGLESSGLTALPRPEFCMYTSGTWLGLGLGSG